MRIKDFLENVCNEIKYQPIREDISEELNLHIQEQKEEYIQEGFSEEIAEEKAVANMGNAEEIGKKLNKVHKPKFDWILSILVVILIGFGFLVTGIKMQRAESGYDIFLARHIVFFIVGLILSIIIYFCDYRKILKHYKIIYGVATALLVITYFFGVNILGRKYLFFCGASFNPSNLCIFLYIIAFIGFLNNMSPKSININVGKIELKLRSDTLVVILLSILSLVLLVVMQNMASMSIILFLSYIIIATIHIIKLPNKKNNLIKLYGVLIAVFAIVLIFSGITDNGLYDRIERGINATYNYKNDVAGYGWVNKLVNDVLSNSNTFTRFDLADEEDTYMDLFYSGTEYALVAIIAYYGTAYAAIIVTIVALLAIKIILDCRNIKDESGRLLMVGFGSYILLQAIFNILMNFNLIPITAINLPFVSYGVTALIIDMMMIGFILSIYRRKDILTKKISERKKLKIKISFE